LSHIQSQIDGQCIAYAQMEYRVQFAPLDESVAGLTEEPMY
jgi:hypothetical protein